MKRYIAIMLILFICCHVRPAYANPKYGVYGSITIIDVSESSQEEKDNVLEVTRNSKNACTIIYDSALHEYSVNSSVLWSGNYSKESFVNIILNYQPEGSYYGSTGWATFYQHYAEQWYDTCTSYGLDPVFMICVSCWQTGFGTSSAVNETGDLFGLRDCREYGCSNIPSRSQEILRIACSCYSDYTTYDTTVNGFGEWIAPEDPEFSSGIARLMNKIFGSLNVSTNITIVGDFRQLKCFPTYISIQ